jgi:hypothetical protein
MNPPFFLSAAAPPHPPRTFLLFFCERFFFFILDAFEPDFLLLHRFFNVHRCFWDFLRVAIV